MKLVNVLVHSRNKKLLHCKVDENLLLVIYLPHFITNFFSKPFFKNCAEIYSTTKGLRECNFQKNEFQINVEISVCDLPNSK